MATKSITTIITFVLVIVFSAGALEALWEEDSLISDGSCNIAVFPVEGAILPFYGFGEFDLITTPDSVEDFLSRAESDPEIEGVLIEINSPGGTPVASERIASRIADSNLPTVGLIGDIGASGGYMVAAATDFLIASPMSDVGSIGVNMSYVENSNQNEENGLTYVQLIAGEHKDIGSPDKPLTSEEREILQRDLDIVYDEFVNIVAKYRDLEINYVRDLADGTSMPGKIAEEVGLIDSVGNRKQATAAMAGFLSKTPDQIKFCEYESDWLLI